MPTPEHGPRYPTRLPPALAEFLKDQEFAALFHGTDQGTGLILKAPRREIVSLRGRVPIRLRHELYEHPAAPVIRTLVTVYDQPRNPLAVETFTNIAEPDQRETFARLAEQERVLMLCYDEVLTHRLTKILPYDDPQTVLAIVATAELVRQHIPEATYDFDRAKADVVRTTSL